MINFIQVLILILKTRAFNDKMKRVRFVFQPILFVLLFISAVTVQAGAYPDFPVALKDGSGALVGETVYAGLGSAGSQI